MLTGIRRNAQLSAGGAHRDWLTRIWDERPVLLVLMFNPSDADHERDDPTCTLVCHVAAHNGYGGIKVMNGIPLRSSKPGPALEMLNWDKHSDWGARDALQLNLGKIVTEVESGLDVLIAWGALAGSTHASADWFDNVREEVECALQPGARLLCLGKTSAGYPLHPLARGKLKVRKDAQLVLWR